MQLFQWSHDFFNFHNYFTCHILTYFYGYSHRVQFSSVVHHVQLFAFPWTAAHQASLSITNSQSLPKVTSIESVMPSSHLILSRPLLLLPPIPPSIRVFSNESTLRMRWPKYWRFFLNPYILLPMARFHSFLWLSNIPLYVYSISSLFIYLLMGRAEFPYTRYCK